MSIWCEPIQLNSVNPPAQSKRSFLRLGLLFFFHVSGEIQNRLLMLGEKFGHGGEGDEVDKSCVNIKLNMKLSSD